MEKLLVVIHVGINGLQPAQIQNYFEQISKSLPSKEEGFFSFIVPDKETDKIKIECLNPVLLTEEEYNNTKEKLEKLNEKLKIDFNI